MKKSAIPFLVFSSLLAVTFASAAWAEDASERLLMRPSMETGYIVPVAADSPQPTPDELAPMLDLEPAASDAVQPSLVAPTPIQESIAKKASKIKRDPAADAPYVPPVKPPRLQEYINSKQHSSNIPAAAIAKPIVESKSEAPISQAIAGQKSVAPEPVPETAPKVTPVSEEPIAKTDISSAYIDEEEVVKPETGTSVQSMTMRELLLMAYKQNATLMAERERLFGLEENVAVAQAAGLPDVSASAGLTAVRTDPKPGSSSSNVEKEAALSVTQPIYKGGRILAGIDQQKNALSASRASYDNTVQTVLLDVVTTAMDVSRNQATIALNKKNRQVLAKQLDATSRGFEVGELTRTDVAQAEARLSGAEAALVVAETGYKDSLAAFGRLLGIDARTVAVSRVTPDQPIPATLEEAQATAMDANPSIRAAELSLKAASDAVRVAQGAVMPDVSATGSATQTYDPTPGNLDESSALTGGLRATLPLYKGGALQARIRQAKKEEAELRERLEETKRKVRQNVEAAWNSLDSARAQMQAFERQTKAAALARDGVYKEREVGTRTILDTLNADKELLDAEVGLVGSQRDEVVAVYTLLAATGQLTEAQLTDPGMQEPVDGVQ